MDTASHKEREHFFGKVKLVALLTMFSRMLGLVRDVAIVALGASRLTDAFWTAFRVPNLFRRLFGEGALAAAFVPVFTEVSESQGPDKARAVLANAAGLLSLILAVLVVLIELAVGSWLILVGGEWDQVLLLQLVMIVVPFMFTICLLALGSAALQCRGRFAYPAFAPILLNIFLIAGAYIAHRHFAEGKAEGLFVLASSVLLAGVVQVALVVWLLKRVQLAAMPCLRPVLPAVRRMAKFALPMMIPLGITQLSAFFDSIYAWIMTATRATSELTIFGWTIAKPLSPGVVTCIYAAGRLYQFPLGILAISLATAIFPLLSRYASRGEMPQLRDATNRALRLSVFLGLPAGVGLIVLAGPIIQLIYGHGKFVEGDIDNVARAAMILRMYSLGMCAYFCNHILLRTFFAMKNTATPLKITTTLAIVNAMLVAGLIFTPMKSAAIGLATAITSTITAALLAWMLARRLGRLGWRRIAASAGRTLIASTAMGATIILLDRLLGPHVLTLGRNVGLAILVASCVAAGIVVYFAAAVILRMPELGELFRSRSSRGRTIT